MGFQKSKVRKYYDRLTGRELGGCTLGRRGHNGTRLKHDFNKTTVLWGEISRRLSFLSKLAWSVMRWLRDNERISQWRWRRIGSKKFTVIANIRSTIEKVYFHSYIFIYFQLYFVLSILSMWSRKTLCFGWGFSLMCVYAVVFVCCWKALLTKRSMSHVIVFGKAHSHCMPPRSQSNGNILSVYLSRKSSKNVPRPEMDIQQQNAKQM